ncbi:MAG: hypothetical protein WAT39_06500 [Planctomycetota bacterium]
MVSSGPCHRLFPVLVTLSLFGATLAQTPAPAVPKPGSEGKAQEPEAASGQRDDLQALAQSVETAHRPKGPVPAVTALRASFEVHLTDPAAEQKGQVDLAVQYLEWTRPGASRPVALLRYQVGDAGTQVTRGRDRDGPWHLVQGKPRDLNADFQQDLDTFQAHANLMKQLVRFLSPGTVLRALQQPGPVSSEVLVVARGSEVGCRTIAGDLASFPLVRGGSDDGPVHVRFFVDQANGRLCALDAWPLRDGKRDDRQGERVLLLDFFERDGLLVPRRILHLFRDEQGKPRPNTEAVLMKLELRPELRAEDFDRTR